MQFLKIMSSFLFTAIFYSLPMYTCIFMWVLHNSRIQGKVRHGNLQNQALQHSRVFAAKSTSDRTGFNGTWTSVDWIWASTVTKVDQRSQFLECFKEWQRSSFSKEADSKVFQKDNSAALLEFKQSIASESFTALLLPHARQGEQEKNKMNTQKENGLCARLHQWQTWPCH